MFIKLYWIDGKGKRKRMMCTFRCDQCQTVFERHASTPYQKRPRHFCSNSCFKTSISTGGISDQAKRQTSLERYGVESIAKLPEVLEKRRVTYTANWGTDHPMKSKKGQQQHSNAMLSRSEDEREIQRIKTRRTFLSHYGVEHPMLDSNSTYKQKRDKTCLKRYGTTVPSKNANVKAKTQATNVERYGVPFPMMNNDVKARMIESLKKNNLQEIAIKRIETMKRNGSFRKSRPEDKMYELLIKQFDSNDVERNKRPEGTAWPIDFYIKSIDTWIQVDGIYWHGLDGQLEEHRLRSCADKRSRIIVYKWETDRKQESWFAERGMKLVRFTDKEVLKMTTVTL
jgi:hypothetical protein